MYNIKSSNVFNQNTFKLLRKGVGINNLCMKYNRDPKYTIQISQNFITILILADARSITFIHRRMKICQKIDFFKLTCNEPEYSGRIYSQIETFQNFK